MKNIFLILISFTIISTCFIWVQANSDANIINGTKNTELNIKWAKLIEKYLVTLKSSLNDLKYRYKIVENKEIDLYNWELIKMIDSLNSIKNKEISKEKAESIMKSIISKLKILNPKIKKLLKIEKERQEIEEEKIAKKYYSLWKKLSIWLDKIILKMLLPLSKKENLTRKDKEIVSHLKNLKIESDKLKNIKSRNIKWETKI